jgi:hypothetical protein
MRAAKSAGTPFTQFADYFFECKISYDYALQLPYQAHPNDGKI